MNNLLNKSDFQRVSNVFGTTRYRYTTDYFTIVIKEKDFNDDAISYMQNFVKMYPRTGKEIIKTLSRFERFNPDKNSVEEFAKTLCDLIFVYNPSYTTISYCLYRSNFFWTFINVEVYGLYEDFFIFYADKKNYNYEDDEDDEEDEYI